MRDISQVGLSSAAVSRFWRKVDKSSECWTWTGCLNKAGYGVLRLHGKVLLAHRVAWAIRAVDPGSMCVLHRCDNPPCVNPAHLFLGTKTDNAVDKISKNRQAKREKNGRAKLTSDEVKEIRAMLAERRMKHADIGKLFGIGRSQVGNISRREQWQ